jgi:hypothetical protein
VELSIESRGSDRAVCSPIPRKIRGQEYGNVLFQPPDLWRSNGAPAFFQCGLINLMADCGWSASQTPKRAFETSIGSSPDSESPYFLPSSTRTSYGDVGLLPGTCR